MSSTNTMTEACTSCVEANDKQCWLRRKRFKLRRHNAASVRRERLVKSLSFCGRLSPEIEDKHERSAASDPATSRKNRFVISILGHNVGKEVRRKLRAFTDSQMYGELCVYETRGVVALIKYCIFAYYGISVITIMSSLPPEGLTHNGG